jgi:hypothetical protein
MITFFFSPWAFNTVEYYTSGKISSIPVLFSSINHQTAHLRKDGPSHDEMLSSESFSILSNLEIAESGLLRPPVLLLHGFNFYPEHTNPAQSSRVTPLHLGATCSLLWTYEAKSDAWTPDPSSDHGLTGAAMVLINCGDGAKEQKKKKFCDIIIRREQLNSIKLNWKDAALVKNTITTPHQYHSDA